MQSYRKYNTYWISFLNIFMYFSIFGKELLYGLDRFSKLKYNKYEKTKIDMEVE